MCDAKRRYAARLTRPQVRGEPQVCPSLAAFARRLPDQRGTRGKHGAKEMARQPDPGESIRFTVELTMYAVETGLAPPGPGLTALARRSAYVVDRDTLPAAWTADIRTARPFFAGEATTSSPPTVTRRRYCGVARRRPSSAAALARLRHAVAARARRAWMAPAVSGELEHRERDRPLSPI